MCSSHNPRRLRHCVGRPSHCGHLLRHGFWRAHFSGLLWLTARPHQHRVGVRGFQRRIWRIRPTGRRTFRREVDRITCCPELGASGIRIGLLNRSNLILPPSTESNGYPKCLASVDHRSSPRRARSWCVRTAMTGQTRLYWTSRSAGGSGPSQRRFPGWSPAWSRWYLSRRRRRRLPTFASMWIREYEKRCGISDFRCALWRTTVAFVTRCRRQTA